MTRASWRFRWLAAAMALAILLPQLRAVTHRHVGQCSCDSATQVACNASHSHHELHNFPHGKAHSHDHDGGATHRHSPAPHKDFPNHCGIPCSSNSDPEHDCGLCKILNQFAGTPVPVLAVFQSRFVFFQSPDQTPGIRLAFSPFYQGRAPPPDSASI